MNAIIRHVSAELHPLQTVFFRLARRTEPPDFADGALPYLRRAATNAALDIVQSKRAKTSVTFDGVGEAEEGVAVRLGLQVEDDAALVAVDAGEVAAGVAVEEGGAEECLQQIVGERHATDVGKGAGDGAEQVDEGFAGVQGAGDGGGGVVDGGVALDDARLGDLHAAVGADAPEVVAQQVDDHGQLGVVLGAIE